MLLYFMATGTEPYVDLPQAQIVAAIVDGSTDQPHWPAGMYKPVR
jgi:hypothetical protein